MKVELLKKLHKRYEWKVTKEERSGKILFCVFDKKRMDRLGCYYTIDSSIYSMLVFMGRSWLFEDNLTRQKRRWSKTKKQNIINQFLNKTNLL